MLEVTLHYVSDKEITCLKIVFKNYYFNIIY